MPGFRNGGESGVQVARSDGAAIFTYRLLLLLLRPTPTYDPVYGHQFEGSGSSSSGADATVTVKVGSARSVERRAWLGIRMG